LVNVRHIMTIRYPSNQLRLFSRNFQYT
jgi:hypothetical protein